MKVGKAYQRIIREKKSELGKPKAGFFFDSPILQSFPNADIKKAELQEISYKEAKRIILEYEWLGTMGTTQYHYGILFENELAGVVCFGYFQAMGNIDNGGGYGTYVGEKYVDRGIQLTRGACVHWAHPHSGSKLISYGLLQMKKLGYKYVVAFSDPKAGEIGTLYQATNWYYLGFSDGERVHYDIWDKENDKVWMNDRDIFKKYGFSGKVKMEKFVSERPTLEVRLRKAKARYMKLIGSRKENKEMFSFLQDKIKSYPKRKN